MTRRILLLGISLLVAGVACHGRPFPLSAQAGSTIVIPMTDTENSALGPFGLGGSDYDDPQRGSLVVHLGSATGFALETRLAFIAAPPVESQVGPWGGGFGRSLLLVVDIPTDAPLGVHDLYIVNERTVDGVAEAVDVTPAPLTIAILPNTVNAGGENVVGEPTPGIFYLGATPFNFEDPLGPGTGNFLLPAVAPPSFGLRVTTANGQVPAGGAGRR